MIACLMVCLLSCKSSHFDGSLTETVSMVSPIRVDSCTEVKKDNVKKEARKEPESSWPSEEGLFMVLHPDTIAISRGSEMMVRGEIFNNTDTLYVYDDAYIEVWKDGWWQCPRLESDREIADQPVRRVLKPHHKERTAGDLWGLWSLDGIVARPGKYRLVRLMKNDVTRRFRRVAAEFYCE